MRSDSEKTSQKAKFIGCMGAKMCPLMSLCLDPKLSGRESGAKGELIAGISLSLCSLCHSVCRATEKDVHQNSV